jgi:hypothetical protein
LVIADLALGLPVLRTLSEVSQACERGLAQQAFEFVS